MQVDASFQNGLAMASGQKDSQVGSQIHASRKKSSISRIYSWLAINLCRLALGGQTVKILRRLVYEFELDQSKSKSSQVRASPTRKWVAKRNGKLDASRKLRRFASPFDRGFFAFMVRFLAKGIKELLYFY